MANIDPSIHFRDLAQREAQAYDSHVNIIAKLAEVEKKRRLSKAELAEKDLSEAVLDEIEKSRGSSGNNSKPVEVCDPLFVAARALLNKEANLDPELRSHHNGRLIFDDGGGRQASDKEEKAARSASGSSSGDLPIPLVALTLGMLTVDAAQPPPVKVEQQQHQPNRGGANARSGGGNGPSIIPNLIHPLGRSFTRAFFAAIGEARSYSNLADKVLVFLAVEGDPDGRGGTRPRVNSAEFAEVMRALAEAEVGEDEPQLRRKVNEALDRVQNIGGEDRIADVGIELPDLEDIQDEAIIEDNVRAMGPMIVSAMFEELKVFQVVDRIVEQFQQGMLPIGPGKAGKSLYKYWREAPNRMSEQERRNFASITLGIPGGNPNAMINSEFNDLWIRFVSSVSSFIRQNEVDALLRSAMPSPISHQQVRKAARDLASNLSLHGYGMAHFAARELQEQIKFMIGLLQDPEIRGVYGARDMWQVVDQVATYDLGGARTSSRYRTLATCGTIITAWLAESVNRINRATGPVIDIEVVRNPPIDDGHKATRKPNDYDLVNACELWLADTATSDTRVEELSQPREAPVMTSKPISMPALARDMLEDLDLPMGLGLGRGTGRQQQRPSAFGGNGSGRPHN
jgi:hypothetical protein